jgi:aspartate aminotransferase
LELQYLPIEGIAAFNKATAELLLGADNPAIKQQRVCSEFRKYNCLAVYNI